MTAVLFGVVSLTRALRKESDEHTYRWTCQHYDPTINRSYKSIRMGKGEVGTEGSLQRCGLQFLIAKPYLSTDTQSFTITT